MIKTAKIGQLVRFYDDKGKEAKGKITAININSKELDINLLESTRIFKRFPNQVYQLRSLLKDHCCGKKVIIQRRKEPRTLSSLPHVAHCSVCGQWYDCDRRME